MMAETQACAIDWCAWAEAPCSAGHFCALQWLQPRLRHCQHLNALKRDCTFKSEAASKLQIVRRALHQPCDSVSCTRCPGREMTWLTDHGQEHAARESRLHGKDHRLP